MLSRTVPIGGARAKSALPNRGEVAMTIARKLAIGAVLIISASLAPLAATAEIKAKRDGAAPALRQTPPALRQTPPPTGGGKGTSQERPKAQGKTKKAKPIDHCKPVSACTCQWEIIDGKRQYVCTPRKVMQ